MKFRSLAIGFCALISLASMASAKIVTQKVPYQSGTVQCEGFMAYDDKFEGKRPAILIAHQWMGLTDYEKTRAVQLASGGFVTFALDLYGKDHLPKNMDEAKIQSGILKNDRSLWRSRANDALKVLQAQTNVDTTKIAAIGYCQGGGTALELARSGADVKGVISFHGTLDTPTPEDAKNIKGKVLVLHGASDPAAPMSTVMGLSDEMTKAGVDFQVVLYGGAVHSFTQPNAGNDPSTGSAYNANADRRSFGAMLGFFDEIFS